MLPHLWAIRSWVSTCFCGSDVDLFLWSNTGGPVYCGVQWTPQALRETGRTLNIYILVNSYIHLYILFSWVLSSTPLATKFRVFIKWVYSDNQLYSCPSMQYDTTERPLLHSFPSSPAQLTTELLLLCMISHSVSGCRHFWVISARGSQRNPPRIWSLKGVCVCVGLEYKSVWSRTRGTGSENESQYLYSQMWQNVLEQDFVSTSLCVYMCCVLDPKCNLPSCDFT